MIDKSTHYAQRTRKMEENCKKLHEIMSLFLIETLKKV